MKKSKVLHIITHLPVGGAQDNTLITVEDLDKSKYEVHLLCGNGGEWTDRAMEISEMKLIFSRFLVRQIHLVYDILAIFQMIALMKREKYDIVHTHSSKPGFIGRLAAKLVGIPVVIHTIHGFPFHDFMPQWLQLFYIRLEQCTSGFSDKLITVSRLNKNKAIQLKIAPPEKFVNIYSGIRFENFKPCVNPEEKKMDLGLPSDKKLVGMVGRLSEQKAPDLFLRAIPEIIKSYPDCHFILVGDGELRPKLEKMAIKLDIKSHIAFLGFREDISEILSILNVYVLSSIYEGLGRSLTEAMYMKCPVVATAVEGVPEIVKHEQTGILIEPRDVKVLESAIIQLLVSPNIAEQLGKNAHNKVVDMFNADKMVREIDLLYQDMIREKRLLN